MAGGASAAPCDTASCLNALVVGISDGDTVTLLVQEDGRQFRTRFRLTEIDTPERGQPWGTRARQALAGKVFRQRVRIMPEGVDRYDRMLGKIYIDGRDINREMVREGHAWAYRRYLSDKSLLNDERLAREAGAGLWSMPEPQQVAPWEWRRNGRRANAAALSSTSPPASFTCGRKTSCREMSSCEEARFYLEQCGLSWIDGDGDGVPCERRHCPQSR
ncbi:MAG: thermonuclease family protein [Gammaproteobacteria bacterium]|nr:thermonuclease family protein [Gammaproteobacteria bacterium]